MASLLNATPSAFRSSLALPTVMKSENDKMDYKILDLSNGMRLLLVSDVQNIVVLRQGDSSESIEVDDEGSDEQFEENDDTENDIERKPTVKEVEEKMAACSLTVGVGSFSDPPDIPGLAHFLEHMVFMGSERHPQENGFDEFIKRHGGSDNASTDCETTSFYFECNEKHLKEGLERFAQFFISPLMKKEAMTRERQVIHSEFEMALPSDGSRREQILASLAPPNHPAGKFLWGNLQTLKDNVNDVYLYQSVHEFREKHYSAHRMTVAIQARLPMKTIETYARKAFSDVPSNHLPGEDFRKFKGKFGTGNFHRLIWIKPVKDIYQVYLTWVLPPLKAEYRSRPIDYVGWLVGHAGVGSLIAYLRDQVFALDCSAGSEESGFEHNSVHDLFSISLTLTELGMEHLSEVIRSVFSYLNMLKANLPSKTIYDELSKISNINFKFKTELPAMSYVESLSESMQLYDEEDYITGGELYMEYSPDLITTVLHSLTVATVNIMVHSASKPESFYTSTEPWFGTLYTLEDIPNAWQASWENSGVFGNFRLPAPNRYLSSNFLRLERVQTSKYPTKIQDTDLLQVWFRQDTKFNLPVAFYYFYLVSPIARSSPRHAALLDVLAAFFDAKFMEHMYPANQAGLYCYFVPADLGLHIQFNGYHEKLPLFIEEILTLMRTCCESMKNQGKDVALLEAVVREKRRSYYNQALKPGQLVKMTRLSLLLDVFWNAVDRREVMDEITLEELFEFATNLLKQVYIQCLVQGNVTPKIALNVCSYFQTIMRCSPLLTNKPKVLVSTVASGERHCRVRSFNSSDSNSVITNYYQAGPTSIRTSCIIDIIMMIMEEPLFDNLRTKQQVGYDVSCLLRDTFGILGFTVTVHFQAHKFHAKDVDRKIETFIALFSSILGSLSKADLDEIKTSLCELKSAADLQLQDEVTRNFAEITSGEYVFDRLQKEVAMIPEISREEVCDWFKDHIKGGKFFKKLSVQVVGPVPDKGAAASAQGTDAPGPMKIRLIAGSSESGTFITDLQDYKKHRMFYQSPT